MCMLKNLLLLLFIVKATLFCQTVTISEILDANLFRLSDGRVVKLAGVDVPSDSSSIPYFRIIASSAKAFINNYSRTQLKMDSISVDEKNRFLIVLLSKKYPLQDAFLNEMFLRNGFGRFINNTNSFNSSELINAQDYAFKNETGIWKFFTPSNTDTLDYMLTKSSFATVIQVDSNKLDNSHNKNSLAVRISFELFAGSGITFLSTLAGGGIVALVTNDGWAGLGGAVIGFGIGYFIGFPSMIHLVAKGENPNLNYWENLGCSWGLTLVNGFIASQIKSPKHPMHYIAWISPIIGSLIYTHIIEPKSAKTNNTLLIPDKKNSSFHDFRESQTTRVELFRINF